jgi:hypothetical protein
MYSIGSTGEEDMNHFDKTLKRNLVSSPPFLCPSMGIEKGRRRNNNFFATCREKIGLFSPPQPLRYKSFIQTISIVRKKWFRYKPISPETGRVREYTNFAYCEEKRISHPVLVLWWRRDTQFPIFGRMVQFPHPPADTQFAGFSMPFSTNGQWLISNLSLDISWLFHTSWQNGHWKYKTVESIQLGYKCATL